MAQNDVRLKLLIDTEGKRVLFAEADKNVVDFLFHLLALPLGTVCKLLKEQTMVGCLGDLYESVEALDPTYLQPNYNKDTLLKPKVISLCSSTLLLNNTDPPPVPKFYICSSSRNNSAFGQYDDYNRCRCTSISDNPKAICPECNCYMTQAARFVKLPSGSTKPVTTEEEGGYVKSVVTCMVMDDLTVNPMSTISSITLLNKFNIKQVNSLEERIITLDLAKGVELLKASLQSKTVLTDVFLSK